jgi:hypothetical protein
MFTPLDTVLFPPNECEIYTDGKSYFYPIFKNGRSSLRHLQWLGKFQTVNTSQIYNLNNITVFIRSPFSRYVSGVNTYINKIVDPSLDRETVLKFVDSFLFLDRHFALQMHWLMHLASFAKPNVNITFKHVTGVSLVSPYWRNPPDARSPSTRDISLESRFATNDRLQFYLLADKLLYNLIDQTVTLNGVFTQLKQHQPDLYQTLIGLPKELTDVLP